MNIKNENRNQHYLFLPRWISQKDPYISNVMVIFLSIKGTVFLKNILGIILPARIETKVFNRSQ